MEEQNDSKVAWPAKATEEVMPSLEPKKEPRKMEFVYADIKGIWMYNPETFIKMDGSEEKHTEPGQIGIHIMWGAKDYGFGEYHVRFMQDGKISVHDELGGPDFSRQLFAYIGEQIATKGEHDRERDEREKRQMAELEAQAAEYERQHPEEDELGK